jgi:hypothetical protein
MKKTALLISLLISLLCYGQTDIETKAHNVTSNLTTLLGLNNEQTEKIYQLQLQVYTDQYNAKVAQEKAKKSTEDRNVKLKSILTPQQWDKYQERVKQIKDSIDNSKLPPWKQK